MEGPPRIGEASGRLAASHEAGDTRRGGAGR